VVTDPDALSLPPHVTADQVRGSVLVASEVVLAGGVGMVSEPARSNLRLTTL
jgi:pyruvate dehydrogenase (quinone)